MRARRRCADTGGVVVERRGLPRRRPAGIVVAAGVLRDVANLLELPHAVLAHVLVLVDAARPRGPRPVAAEHRHDVPAALARLAIVGERDDRLHRDMRIDAPIAEADATATQ